MAKEKKEKAITDPYMDYMVKLVVWLNAVFGFLIWIAFMIHQQEPTTLIQFWFGSFTMELLAMATIKITGNWRKGGDASENKYGQD